VKTVSQEMLGEATRRLTEEFQPEEIWLFGSHAWGTPHADSDVDLMVIVSQSEERSIQRMQRAHRCLSGIGFPKDVLVPTRAEVDRYKHLRASLFHQVLTQGRKLYGGGQERTGSRLADTRQPRSRSRPRLGGTRKPATRHGHLRFRPPEAATEGAAMNADAECL